AVAYLPYVFVPNTCAASCQVGWDATFLFAVIAGLGVRESRRLNKALEEQNDLLRQTREEGVRLAVVAERSRIARDVHDLVGHSVPLMVIQAGVARGLAETDRLQADQALAAVERAGEEALSELHSMVRSMDGEGAVSPVPTGERFTIQSLVDREI